MDNVDLPHVRAKKIWRGFNADGVADFKIGISASFTVGHLVDMLGCALLDMDIKPALYLGAYNQLIQTCLNHQGMFENQDLDVIVMLWRIEDVMPLVFERFVMGCDEGLDAMKAHIDELVSALLHLRQQFSGQIVISIPPFPQGSMVELSDLDTPLNAGRFHREVIRYFLDRTSDIHPLHLLDLDALQRGFGMQAAFDTRKWYLYKQPYSEPFLWTVGHVLARMIRANTVAPKKCIVLDCDNTLWGGIVGEDGIEGIQLGPEGFPGSAFYDLQKYMVYLHSKGILLALASKNNENDVWAVFDSHDGMVLKREHIAAWRIDWHAKSANIQAMADELNIGVDSMVFIDDNPFEIEQVQVALPGVTLIQLDSEPANMIKRIKEKHLFDRLSVTEEDRNRTGMIHAERSRKHLISTVNYSMLNLEADIKLASLSQLERVTQLINKTNQFNLTTVRRTLDEVRQLHDSPDWDIYTMRVSDKFGDYGLVGVALIEKLPDAWYIDSFLMSCRALGRHAESALLAKLAGFAKHHGVEVVKASFIPTNKNTVAAEFLVSHGFIQHSEHGFEAAVSQIPPAPPGFTIYTSQGQ
ncbi:MAG: HAD-IIIC family phosphatase [Gammaproteobacteria bacterium]|nr:HAD-IIIC family phosphatase [Gammaproteobacteria bacterium]